MVGYLRNEWRALASQSSGPILQPYTCHVQACNLTFQVKVDQCNCAFLIWRLVSNGFVVLEYSPHYCLVSCDFLSFCKFVSFIKPNHLVSLVFSGVNTNNTYTYNASKVLTIILYRYYCMVLLSCSLLVVRLLVMYVHRILVQ